MHDHSLCQENELQQIASGVPAHEATVCWCLTYPEADEIQSHSDHALHRWPGYIPFIHSFIHSNPEGQREPQSQNRKVAKR